MAFSGGRGTAFAGCVMEIVMPPTLRTFQVLRYNAKNTRKRTKLTRQITAILATIRPYRQANITASEHEIWQECTANCGQSQVDTGFYPSEYCSEVSCLQGHGNKLLQLMHIAWNKYEVPIY